ELGCDEDDVGAVVRITMPAEPQSLAEILSSHRAGELEHERLVEFRRHVPRMAPATRAAPDTLGSFPLESEAEAQGDERDAAEPVERPLDARPGEDVAAPGGQLGIGQQPDDAHAVEEHAQQQEV